MPDLQSVLVFHGMANKSDLLHKETLKAVYRIRATNCPTLVSFVLVAFLLSQIELVNAICLTRKYLREGCSRILAKYFGTFTRLSAQTSVIPKSNIFRIMICSSSIPVIFMFCFDRVVARKTGHLEAVS